MSTTYPTTITDKTGRVWEWSEQWGGYRHPGQLTHGYDTIRDQWGIATIVPEVGAQYTLGGGSTVYTVASVNENMAMLTWTKPGDIGIRNRYLAAVEFGRLVPIRHTGQHLQGCVSCYEYVAREVAAEMREREAIQADAENERDGYRG